MSVVMAEDAEEGTEYESDPEEAILSLKTRRKEASDDEGSEEEDDRSVMVRDEVDSGVESDGQGGAAEYDDDESEVDEEVEEDYYDGEEEEIGAEEEFGENSGEVGCVGGRGEGEALDLLESGEVQGQGQVEEEERKEKERSTVPTAGAFYMHDDRFRDSNVGGRHRRTFGGSKLWESKDDTKWGHDKFEEINMKERQYNEISSRGHSRGHGRSRVVNRGFGTGNRSRPYNENNKQSFAPRIVRGRGPRRYQALTRGKSEAPPPQNKQSQKPLDKGAYASSGRANSAAHIDYDPIPPKRVASHLNSASAPFYPSRASNKENNTLTHKRIDQTASVNRNIHASRQESLSVQQTNSLLRGKNALHTVGMDKLYIDKHSLERPIGNAHMASPSLSTNAPQSRGHGRDVLFQGSKSFQFSSQNVVRKTSSAAQTHYVPRNHVQGQGQASLPLLARQLGHQSDSASQHPSPAQAGLSIATLESGDEDLPIESSNSKSAVVGKGKGSTQGGQWGSFLYGSAQLMGSSGTMGGSHPATPAFFPVMQFGGQNSSGIGVPAVGMAFPGYVAQSQHGLGNSEMTWLPVLTGSAGALGATYSPPQIAFDGRPADQSPALLASSKDHDGNISNNELKHQQKSELVNEKFNQRQNKSRRYSEMNFCR